MSMLINPSAYDKLEYFYKNKEEFYFVSDFDATLNTYYNSDWQRTQWVVALLHHYGTLSDRYTRLAQAQFDRYEPLEHDTSLEFSDRLQAMVDRWTQNLAYLAQERLRYDILKQTVALGKIDMRPWAERLIRTAQDLNIPFVIFSASSIGFDAIDLTLQSRGIDVHPEYIVANRMKRDEEWYLVWLDSPLIHSLNKTESAILLDPHYATIQDHLKSRPHAILIGDQIHDGYMLQDRDDRVLLRVGLHNTVSKKQEFLDHFDIVIEDDGDFYGLYDLIFGRDITRSQKYKKHFLRSTIVS